jgi:hypothetical protein
MFSCCIVRRGNVSFGEGGVGVFTGGGGISDLGELGGDPNGGSTKSSTDRCSLEDVIDDSEVDGGV